MSDRCFRLRSTRPLETLREALKTAIAMDREQALEASFPLARGNWTVSNATFAFLISSQPQILEFGNPLARMC